jgi:glycosyltransferase involved in cell wall biosynthesis
MFIYSLSGGGAERVSCNLANHWAEKGWEVTIVTLTPQATDFYGLHPDVKRIALEQSGTSGNLIKGLGNNIRRVFALRRVLRKVEPNIALAMMTTANVLLSLASWGLPEIRAIGSERIHPPQFRLGTFWEILRRYTYSRLYAVVALTCESAKWLRRHTRVQRTIVIPNAALKNLSAIRPRLNPESYCLPGRRLLLAVGRLEAQKGYDDLIGAFIKLSRKFPDWDLAILGEGSLRRTLEAQVHDAALEKRVFLPGRVGNVGEWYERADLCVMSSRYEGFPNALVEAMAYGLPVVSYDCDTGSRDIIRHETDGILVPREDLLALSAALSRVMGDEALRLRFSKKAVEARERFSMERIAEMWEKLFEET